MAEHDTLIALTKDKMTSPHVPCNCCGQPAPRAHATQEFGFCASCHEAGCTSACDGEGNMLRAATCPLVRAVAAKGADVCMCLQCGKPLHRSEPLTFINNSNPGAGGCHFRCLDAYYASRKGM